MQFLYPVLAWGFLLVGLPVLIHLINMLRHRRRKWAAMEFLLESHQKNRRWVMLKQWLLLLARMLAMAVLVLLLARWVSKSEWLSALGGQTTHHYVLLDDSYSMGQSDGSTTAYREAISALNGLVKSIAAQPGDHQLTLLRYSRAALATQALGDGAEFDSAQLVTAADLSGQSVPRDPEKLLDRISASEPSGLATTSLDALQLIGPQITASPEQAARVYLLTDVRQREFGEAAKLKAAFEELADQGADFSVVTCDVPSAKPNISVVSLEPPQDVWAAGVPLQLGFQVRNNSDQPVRNLVVQLTSFTYDASEPSLQDALSGMPNRLPPIVIEQLGPGETVSRKAQVLFSRAGSHVVEVSVPDDALALDNRRWATINIEQSQKVLLIDGDPERKNAFLINALLSPDAKITTGVDADVEDDVFLRDTAPELWQQYDVICLLDVPRLDKAVVAQLTQYVRGGGGLFFLTGPNTNSANLDSLFYDGGEGPFPAPVKSIEEFPGATAGAQVQLAGHAILEPLEGLSSSPFFALQIRKLFRLDEAILKERGGEPIAVMTAGFPFAVDMPLGEGHVVSALTGLTPEWSTWSTDPTFVVFMLRTIGYLGSFKREQVDAPVATPVDLVVGSDQMLPEAEIILPARRSGQEAAARLRFESALVVPDAADSTQANGQRSAAKTPPRVQLNAQLGQSDRELLDAFLRPGVIEVWMTQASGDRTVRSVSHNVSPQDGNLATTSTRELNQTFGDLPVRIVQADTMAAGPGISQDSTQSTFWMVVLIAILIVEQLLAYSCSYHSSSGATTRTRTKGGIA